MNIKKLISDMKATLQYELSSSGKSLKRIDSWKYIFFFLSVIFVFLNKILLVICLIVLFLLKMKKDYDSGKVKSFQRERFRNSQQARIYDGSEEGLGHSLPSLPADSNSEDN